jgi:hypothetical protein
MQKGIVFGTRAASDTRIIDFQIHGNLRLSRESIFSGKFYYLPEKLPCESPKPFINN